MYDGNPREIDFGSSQRGFELSGVDCSYASVLSMTHSLGWDSLEKLRNLDYGDESKFGIHTVHKDLIVLNILLYKYCGNKSRDMSLDHFAKKS